MLKACFSSPKLRALQKLLGISLPSTVGHLELLWLFTSDHAPHGNVGRWSNLEIASACEWDGDADFFVKCLTDTRWLDEHLEGRLIVHDWHQHAPRWVSAVVAKTKKPFYVVSTTEPTTVATTEPTTVATTEPTHIISYPIISNPCEERTHATALRNIIDGGFVPEAWKNPQTISAINEWCEFFQRNDQHGRPMDAVTLREQLKECAGWSADKLRRSLALTMGRSKTHRIFDADKPPPGKSANTEPPKKAKRIDEL